MGNNLVKAVLGRTGMEVTRLGYGAMAIRDTSTQISETILNEVIDHGVNFIDTSNAVSYTHLTLPTSDLV